MKGCSHCVLHCNHDKEGNEGVHLAHVVKGQSEMGRDLLRQLIDQGDVLCRTF